MIASANNFFSVKHNALVYAYVFLMLFFLLMRNAFDVNFPVAFFLIISSIPLIFGSNTHIIAVGLSCMPFSTGFQYKITLFLCIIALLIKNRKTICVSRSTYFVLVMMAWELVHFFCGDFSLIEFFRSFAELMFFSVVTCIDYDDIDVKTIFRVFSVCVIGICGIMLYMQLLKFGFNLFSIFASANSKYRFGSMNSEAVNFGLNFNSNGLGYICNLSSLGMISLIARKENLKIDYVLLFLSVLFGAATLSRTFFVCLFVLFVLYIFSSNHNLKKTITRIGFVLGIVLFVYTIVLLFVPQVMLNFFNRLEDPDISNGRSGLFVFYLHHIFSEPQYILFGIGLQDLQEKISLIYGSLQQVCHNGLEEVWVAWGPLGVFLFFGMLLNMAVSALKNNKDEKILRLLPLFILLLDSSAGQLIRSGNVMLSLVFVYLALNVKLSNRKIVIQ